MDCACEMEEEQAKMDVVELEGKNSATPADVEEDTEVDLLENGEEISSEQVRKLISLVEEGKRERERLLNELNDCKKRLKMGESQEEKTKIQKNMSVGVQSKPITIEPEDVLACSKTDLTTDEEDLEDASKKDVLIVGDMMLRMAEENCLMAGMDIRIFGGIRVGELATKLVKMWDEGKLKKVETVVVMVGTNNIRKGFSFVDLKGELERETQRLLIAIKSIFGVVVKIGVMGIMGRFDKSELLVTVANEGIEEACKKEGGLYVETRRFVSLRYLNYGGLYLSPAGGDILGQLIIRVVRRLQRVGRVVGLGEKKEASKVIEELQKDVTENENEDENENKEKVEGL